MPRSVEIPLHLYQVLEEEYINLHGPLEDDDDIEMPVGRAGAKQYRWVRARRDWLFHRGHIKNPVAFVLKLLSHGERAHLEATTKGARPPRQPEALRAPDAAPEPDAAVGGEAPAVVGREGALFRHLLHEITYEVVEKVYREVSWFPDLDDLYEPKEDGAAGGDAGRAALSAAAAAAPMSAAEEAARSKQVADENYEERRRRARAALTELEERLSNILQNEQDHLYTTERFKHITLSDTTAGLLRIGAKTFSFKDRVRFEGDDLIHFKRLLLEDAFPEEIEKIYDIRLAAINGYFHKAGQAALCLSGGGIRSGTFALGLIQGLARRDLLKEFQYLSTVSGGGYMGGWLSAWIHRHRDGLAGVTNDLWNTPPETKIDPDPAPIRHLRRYSNFITPKVGLLTADTWTFITIYLRNLLLNWSVIIPLLLGWLMLPRLYNSLLLARTPPKAGAADAAAGVTLAGYALSGRHLLLSLGCLLAVVAIAYVAFNRPYVREQLRVRSPFWYKRTGQRSFLRWCLMPLTGAAVCVTIYWAWSHEAHRAVNDATRGIRDYLIFGAALCVLGWLGAMCVLRRLPWAAPALVAALAWAYLRGDLSSFWSLAPLVAVVIMAVVEWLIVRRVTHLTYAQPRELSPFEVGSLALAGVGGGAFLWLGEHVDVIPTQFNTSWTTWTTELYTCLGVPAFLGAFLLSLALFIGFTSHRKEFTDEDREWWARAGAWVFIVVIAWVTFGALVIFGPLALLSAPYIISSVGGASGVASLLAGRSSKTPANDEKQAEGGMLSSLAGSLLPLLAALFLAFFVVLLSLLTSLAVVGIAYWRGDDGLFGRPLFIDDGPGQLSGYGLLEPYTHMLAVHYPSFWLTLGLMVAFAGFGLLMGRVINLNRFSLHAGYRDRLVRGFLGASRDSQARKPNPFTGFDPLDDVRMHELRHALLSESNFTDFAGLALELRDGQSPYSEYIRQNVLSDETKSELAAYSPDALPSQFLKLRLIEDLNRALEDEEHPIYMADAFVRMRDAEFARLRAEELARRDEQRRRLEEELRRRELGEQPQPVPQLPARRPAPPAGIMQWASERSREKLEQYKRSHYAVMLNRLLLQEAFPGYIRKKYPPPYRLMHVVNTTLNLVGGDNLAWQQRKAEPFSVTPLHSGCFRLGYRKSRNYGGAEGVRLGTAVAVSGAAASSNMGYYTSSPVLSMVLTLFNVRLGWWLGNPGPAGADSYRRQSPRLSMAPVLAEAFGLTDDKNKYVYLTDGGHFENLALYEMVLRRCRVIIVSDAAADEDYQFNDLGNAVRKIRIDLGVPIEFGRVPIFGKSLDGAKGGEDAREGAYWAVGRIEYSCVDKGAEDGLLIYIKPAVYGREPQDVLHYKRSHASFPHETTADQFFDEPQFESYRALGSHVMEQMYSDAGHISGLEELGARIYWQGQERWGWPEIEADWLKRYRPPATASHP